MSQSQLIDNDPNSDIFTLLLRKERGVSSLERDKTKKKTGPDSIPALFVRDCAYFLARKYLHQN